ncbi:hypothetical protein V1525DRAFT_421062 [Lipomyces kononenkoae]|uniref:Uncharacterized protein n=1 Tax=Lipomyces kononenkoae TaxID=34357 RepID=A0ACC3SWG0_LIPKO
MAQPPIFITSPSAGTSASEANTPAMEGSLIAPPQLPAVGGDLALQNEVFLHNTQMEGVRKKYALRPIGTSQAYESIQRRFTTELIEKGSRNRQEPYSLSTLKFYVATITDLWKQQLDFGVNPHSSPRTANVLAILRTYSRVRINEVESYADRGAGSIFEGCNAEGMRKAAHATLSRPYNYGDRIQGLLDFLLGHYLLLRGNNIELADLYLLPLENEGPTKCKYRQEKSCGEAPRRQGTDRTASVDYKNTQMKWTNRMFREANILSTKKTHAGRKAGAQMAEVRGVGEEQIRRAGRWNRDELTSYYLTSLPFKCIKAMSGLSPKGDFYIARAEIVPPVELQKKISPTVDYWLARYNGQTKTDPTIEGTENQYVFETSKSPAMGS